MCKHQQIIAIIIRFVTSDVALENFSFPFIHWNIIITQLTAFVNINRDE